MTEINIARTENKYLLDKVSSYRVKRNLKAVLPVDRPGAAGGYMVRSLYFDTIYDKDYYDKLNGLDNRQKIRLRIYNPEDTTAKLEVKEKQGSYQWKRSITISRQDAMLLIQGRYDELIDKYSSLFMRTVLRKMQIEVYIPKIIIEFNRLAFINETNNIRITFDTELKSTEASFNLYSSKLNLKPIIYPVILEVKYNNFLLSYIKSALNLANQVPTSTSKYCLGRQL